jgi:hypothetical protein
MWNRLMAAAWAMPMVRFMSSSAVLWRAAIRIRWSYFNYVFVNMSLTNMMQVAVFDIIDVVLVANRGMTTIGSVDVRVIGDWHADLLSSAVQRSIDPFLTQALIDRICGTWNAPKCRQGYKRSALDQQMLEYGVWTRDDLRFFGNQTRDVELPAASEDSRIIQSQR